jgi:predicted acetylornithine/succinylornithine family transaminase
MQEELIAAGQDYLANTYRRMPLILVRGQGCKVWDINGKEYLDFVAGIAVNNLGHCHPRVVEAIQQQAARLIHVSNLYYIQPQIELARLLVNNSFADKVFFCNSGAEAVEGAIKLARRYSQEHFGSERYEIICMEHSFHGRTMGALSATGQIKYHQGYQPMLPGFVFVPYNDLDAVRQAITTKTCAILVEPIQGEGGINIPDSFYLPGLRDICQKHKLLLIYDEIQTGMGRTAKLFAYQHSDTPPDIMTLAKALAGGVPMGALLARAEVMESFTPGSHASTFGGNPLASAAALATVNTLLEDNLLDHCRIVGEYFKNCLTELAQKSPLINNVRGRGLMLGMELNIPGADIVNLCREKGFLINCTMDKVLRFVPPLIIEEKEIDQLLETLEAIIQGYQSP